MASLSMCSNLATESELKSKLSAAKREQEFLSMKITQIMGEGQFKPLEEQASFIAQMTEYNVQISKSIVKIQKLQADLDAYQKRSNEVVVSAPDALNTLVSTPETKNDLDIPSKNNQVMTTNSIKVNKYNPGVAFFETIEKNVRDDTKGEQLTVSNAAIKNSVEYNIAPVNQTLSSTVIPPQSIVQSNDEPKNNGFLGAMDSLKKGLRLSFNPAQVTPMSPKTDSMEKTKKGDGLMAAIGAMKKGQKLIFNPANSMPKNDGKSALETNSKDDGLMAAISAMKTGQKLTFNNATKLTNEVINNVENVNLPSETGNVVAIVKENINKYDPKTALFEKTWETGHNLENHPKHNHEVAAVSIRKVNKYNPELAFFETIQEKESDMVGVPENPLPVLVDVSKEQNKYDPQHALFHTTEDANNDVVVIQEKENTIIAGNIKVGNKYDPQHALFETTKDTKNDEVVILENDNPLVVGKAKKANKYDPGHALFTTTANAALQEDESSSKQSEPAALDTLRHQKYVEITCPGLESCPSTDNDKVNKIILEELQMPWRNTKSVRGDGSCYDYSCLELLSYPYLQEGTNMAGIGCHKSNRKVICDFLRNNTELHKQDCFELMKFNAVNELIHRKVPKNLQTWEHYLDEMANDTRCFADATYIRGAALYLKKDILIAGPTNTPQQPWTLVSGSIPGTSFKSQGQPLTLFRMNLHYEPIVRMKTESDGCRGCGEVTKDISAHLAKNEKKLCHIFYAEHSKENQTPVTDIKNATLNSAIPQQEQENDEPISNVPQEQGSEDKLAQSTTRHVKMHERIIGMDCELKHSPSLESDMPVHANECHKCLLQYASSNSLGDHRRTTQGNCLKRVCNEEEHQHEYLVKKFTSEEEAKDYILKLDGSWQKPKRNRNEIFKMTCDCVDGCQAKLRYQPVTRPDGTRDFLLQACMKHKVDNSIPDIEVVEMEMALQGEMVEEIFPSEAAAREHIEKLELDSFLRRRYRHPRKNGSHYEYYQCRRKEKYCPKSYSSKKNTGCVSKFTLTISPEGPVTMKSLLKHNHEEDEHSVMSQKERDKAAAAFKHGVSVKTYMDQQYAVPSHERTKGRLGDTSDFRRLHQKNAPQKVDITQKEKINVLKGLENPAWRGFSLNGHYGEVPKVLQHKENKQSSIFMFYMSDRQRQILAQYPQTLHMDGSHGTNRHGLQWVNFMVFDNRGCGIPVGHALVPQESEENLTPALKIIKKLEPEACEKIEFVSTDLAKCFLNTFQAVVKKQVKWIPCAWHLERAWRTNLQQSVPKMHKDLQELRLETSSVDNFDRRYTVLNDYYTSPAATKIEREKWKYFTENYSWHGTVAKPSDWARVHQKGCVPHNLYVERLHGEFKRDNKKSNMRIDELMYAIEELANKKEYHFIMRRQRKNIGIKDSQAVRLFNYNHFPMKGYSIEIKEDYDGTYCLVRKEATDKEEEKSYVLCQNKLSQCTGDTCQVRCKTCPPESPCSHEFGCTCIKYARTNICKHQHLLYMFLAGVPHTRPEPMKKPRAKRGAGQIPTLSQKRTHELQPQFGKLPVKKKGKKAREPLVIDPRETAMAKSIILLISKSPKSEDWGNWVTGDESQFHQFLIPLTYAEEDIVLKKYEEARSHWKCLACPDQTMEKHKKGWVTCDVCKKLCHISCSPFENKEQATSSGPWHCCSCRQTMRQQRRSQ